MKRFLAFAALVVTTPALGQQVQQQAMTITLPTFTTDQNWTRASTLIYASQVSGYSFAKSRGVSPEEFGRWVGEAFAPGWGPRDGGSAIGYARSIQNNLRAMTGTATNVLTANDTLIVMRALRPYVSYFGPTKQAAGVTLDEHDAVVKAFYEAIGQYLGLHYAQRLDSATVTMTISGRGKNAVIEFPRATYAVTFTPPDANANPMLVGSWEATYGPNGKYTLRHDGQPFVQTDYEFFLDEVVFRNETNSIGTPPCPGPGRYRWTINPTNGNLTLGRLADDCANRVAFLTRRPFGKKDK